MIRSCLSAVIMMIALAGVSLPAESEPVDAGRAVVDIIAEAQVVAPGDTVYAAVHMEIDEGWHVYWRQPGDAGLPPEIALKDGSTLTDAAIGDFIWPIPHLLPVIEGEIMDYGYDDQLVLPFPVTIPADASGEVVLDVLVDYLICEEICVPEDARITRTLRVGDRVANEAAGTLISDAIAKAPTDLQGVARIDTSADIWPLSLQFEAPPSRSADLRFFPFRHDIVHSADQPFTFGSAGATLNLTPDGALEGPLEGVVIVTEPGADPVGYTVRAGQGAVLPDTAGLAGLAKGGGAATPGTGLLTLMAFAVLGGLILNLMPCVLPVLSIKAVGMVSAAASGHASEVRSHGIWYTLGVLVSFAILAAIIVVIRQTAGGANLGFQLQHGPTVAVLALIMFSIGLWLMGAFELGTSIQNTGSGLASKGGAAGAFFTGVLAAIVGAPCIGPFLGATLGAVMSQPAIMVFAVFLAMGFGLALPFLLISFVPGLQKLLPKPGAWMETLKQVFAFPMFLTAAWLLSVLGALAGSGAVAWTAAGAAAIGFAVWAAGKGGAVFKAIAAAALVAGFVYPAVQANTVPPANGVSTAYATKYETETWSPERVAELVREGRPIFVDFTATWCATCQVNKRTTLKTKAVQDAFAEANVAFLVADFTRKDPVIAEELKLRNRAGVPMYLWYAPGETEPDILPEILSPGLVTGLVENR